MFTLDIATAANLTFALVLMYAQFYVTHRARWDWLGEWRGFITICTFIPAAVRVVYYTGTIFFGWDRISHGDLIAFTNPLALLGSAMMTISWLRSQAKTWQLENKNAELEREIKELKAKHDYAQLP